jgi:transcriptional regulator with XRE-family HTH domain
MNNIEKIVKEIIREKGLTQSELADKLGVTRVSLSKTLAGNPTIDTLQRIAVQLSVPLWRLVVDPVDLPTNGSIKCPNCGKIINIKVE